MSHQHVYARVPKLAGSWIACECGEPWRGRTGVDLINEREDLDRKLQRLIELVAMLNASLEHGLLKHSDRASELWRALPDDLRREIEMREAAIG